jgi:hypothetical protein
MVSENASPNFYLHNFSYPIQLFSQIKIHCCGNMPKRGSFFIARPSCGEKPQLFFLACDQACYAVLPKENHIVLRNHLILFPSAVEGGSTDIMIMRFTAHAQSLRYICVF